MTTEYRAVWPNGAEVDDLEKREGVGFLVRFEHLCARLRSLGVPPEYWPKVESREVEVIAGEWAPDQGKQVLSQSESVAIESDSTGFVWGTPSPEQIQRVKLKQLGIYDPCVICGQVFNDCPHTRAQTASFVTYVKGLI